MYGGIIVPEKVKEELKGTPAVLEMQMTLNPLKVMHASNTEDIHLDAGETEAVALYKEINADLFLTDDNQAYKYCTNNNINVKKFIDVIKDLKEVMDISSIKDRILNSDYLSFTSEIFHRILEV